MILFDRVSKRYANGREALNSVSFEVHTGELVFLTGRSGAGKSTVLKLIALLERPTRGTVVVNGHNTQTLKARHIAAFRRRIGVVFQDHKLLADRPVYDNVALPLAVAATPLKEIDKRVRAALDQVGLLGKERALPPELSVGEQQRVGIARAVISKPPLLIADEPTGNLDPDLSLEVMRLFRRFQDVGVTVVIATHDHHLVREFAQRVLVLENGRLQGDPRRRAALRGGDAMSLVVAVGRHLQALLGSVGRLARAPLATLLTLLVIALALALPAALRLFVTNAQPASGNFVNAVDLSVYLHTDVPLAKAQQLAQVARQRREVAAVKVIPADQGLADFRTYSGFGDALAALEDNPLPHVLHVRPRAAGQLAGGARFAAPLLRAWPEVDIVQLDADGCMRFNAILELLRRLLIIPAALLGVGVLAIIGNTIRLEISARRAEIEVTKLVGGSNAFVRRPFLYTGVLYGLGGALLAWGLIALAIVVLGEPVATLARLYGSPFAARTGAADVAALLGGGAMFGWLGAWLSAARHLRSIEPRA